MIPFSHKYIRDAWEWKISLLRYRAFRQVAELRLILRTIRDKVYIWPPFEPTDEEQLTSLRSGTMHYLRALDVDVRFFRKNDHDFSCMQFTPANGLGEDSIVGTGAECENELKQARYCLLWKYRLPIRLGSLHPHLYFVAQGETYVGGVNEWLRLVSDIFLSERSLPVRAADFPRNLASCAVLGSGPSFDRFFCEHDRWDGWIGCNFVLCDERIDAATHAIAYCAADPFLFSAVPSFTSLRERTFDFLRRNSAVYVTLQDFAPFVELYFPSDILPRCHYVRSLGHDTYWPTTCFEVRKLTVTPYGNVLTDLMLPLAASVSPRIVLYGCDGRPPGHRSLPKSTQMQQCDEKMNVDAPEIMANIPDDYIDKFSLYTAFVASECQRHGAEIFLRAESWNKGLSGLPILPGHEFPCGDVPA